MLQRAHVLVLLPQTWQEQIILILALLACINLLLRWMNHGLLLLLLLLSSVLLLLLLRRAADSLSRFA